MKDTVATAPALESTQLEQATFAGGCFWCTESDFEKVPGVTSVISGFSGGTQENPSYKQVSSGKTTHTESVLVTYNPDQVSYKDLLDVFWRHVDPTDNNGQFVDRGKQYRPAIFYHTQEQKLLAERSKKELQVSEVFEEDIVVEISPFISFYEAEEYHQDYFKKNPLRYNFYRGRSGRDQFLDKTWGEEKDAVYERIKAKQEYSKPSDEVLRKTLTPLQYKVTQNEGTERPFNNKYWDNKDEGIYVDIVSGEPLFSSIHKYKSGTGWPSFTEPLEPKNIVTEDDYKLFIKRTEVRSKHGDSHLGHVFPDGPEDKGGLRYCLNSAALKFVPKEDLVKEGYEEYKDLF